MREFFTQKMSRIWEDYAPGVKSDNPITEYTKQRLTQNLYHGGDAADVKKELIEGLEYLKARQDLSMLHGDAEKVVDEVTNVPEVAPNFGGVRDAQQKAKTYLDQHQKRYRTIAQQLEKGYDTFLDTLSTYSLVSNSSEGVQEFGASLFSAPEEFVQELRDAPSPLQSYLNLYAPHVDGFANALERETPTSL